jgi:hypothetical protein
MALGTTMVMWQQEPGILPDVFVVVYPQVSVAVWRMSFYPISFRRPIYLLYIL